MVKVVLAILIIALALKKGFERFSDVLVFNVALFILLKGIAEDLSNLI